MDDVRTKSTTEKVTEKYKSDIFYVSELVSKYEHELIRRDDRIEKLQSDNHVLEEKLTLINDRLFECMYEFKCNTKQITKTELVKKMSECYRQISEIQELF